MHEIKYSNFCIFYFIKNVESFSVETNYFSWQSLFILPEEHSFHPLYNQKRDTKRHLNCTYRQEGRRFASHGSWPVSPSVSVRLNFSETGMPLSRHSWCHSTITSCLKIRKRYHYFLYELDNKLPTPNCIPKLEPQWGRIPRETKKKTMDGSTVIDFSKPILKFRINTKFILNTNNNIICRNKIHCHDTTLHISNMSSVVMLV